jgi:hypothetical protein
MRTDVAQGNGFEPVVGWAAIVPVLRKARERQMTMTANQPVRAALPRKVIHSGRWKARRARPNCCSSSRFLRCAHASTRNPCDPAGAVRGLNGWADGTALLRRKFPVYSKCHALSCLSFPEFKVPANEAISSRRRSVHTGNDLPDNQAHGSVVECGAIQL